MLEHHRHQPVSLHYLIPRSQVCLCPISLMLQCLEDITRIKGIHSNLITLLILDKLHTLLMVILPKVLPNNLPLLITHLDNSLQILANPHNGDKFSLCKILL